MAGKVIKLLEAAGFTIAVLGLVALITFEVSGENTFKVLMGL